MQLMSIKIGLLSVLLLKTCVRKKGGLGGFAPQTLTRSYYFEPPLSKKRSRATGRVGWQSVYAWKITRPTPFRYTHSLSGS